MNKIKKVLATAMVGTLAFSVVGCKMIQKTPEAIQNTVIAKVGDEKITKGDIDKELKSYLDQFAAQYGDNYEEDPKLKEVLHQYRVNMMNTLINEKILLKKAKDLNLIPEQAELDKEIQSRIDQLKTTYGTEENFQKVLEASGHTDETFKKFIEEQVIAQKATEYIFKDINISDEDVKAEYEKNKENYGEANVSHILIADENKAKEIRERAANGEDFAELAKEFSEDPGSKDKGGDYGVIPYNSDKYVKEFVDGFKTLKEGEISQPVKSQYGYHIIKATNVKNYGFDDVKDEIKSELETAKKKEAYNKTMEEWKNEIKVKTYEDKI
ncbi:peptidylprolyl isomerase [Clostridium septicum]|uniref:Foldase protein PrsA n=1 Tax=Clostridium septicum TaxID=1504 RepID=A0A9N7PLB4_CLOSE|nr:peptidylprolyl isomerase [Clostridium septicum]AYE34471.1 peptidylprolyl isomerase [Clostridium septicum]MDU1312449.1 peptidylprolyl isomerase [Clostridium septicum]QAS59873.1 peptidylprolyl isomerase [Clostridium septicum]UEC20887.1 peptidylprolyl isomerase [Clostridium septicum]USS01063.1 peptidylprolyl isomerase [Clostridium septicum]